MYCGGCSWPAARGIGHQAAELWWFLRRRPNESVDVTRWRSIRPVSGMSYPTAWVPSSAVPEDHRQFPVSTPDDAWMRITLDPRGLPYPHLQAFWMTADVLHLATASGWVTDLNEADDPDEEIALVGHERINTERILQVTHDLSTGGCTTLLVNDEVRTDFPSVPLAQYFEQHRQRL